MHRPRAKKPREEESSAAASRPGAAPDPGVPGFSIPGRDADRVGGTGAGRTSPRAMGSPLRQRSGWFGAGGAGTHLSWSRLVVAVSPAPSSLILGAASGFRLLGDAAGQWCPSDAPGMAPTGSDAGTVAARPGFGISDADEAFWAMMPERKLLAAARRRSSE